MQSLLFDTVNVELPGATPNNIGVGLYNAGTLGDCAPVYMVARQGDVVGLLFTDPREAAAAWLDMLLATKARRDIRGPLPLCGRVFNAMKGA